MNPTSKTSDATTVLILFVLLLFLLSPNTLAQTPLGQCTYACFTEEGEQLCLSLYKRDEGDFLTWECAEWETEELWTTELQCRDNLNDTCEGAKRVEDGWTENALGNEDFYWMGE